MSSLFVSSTKCTSEFETDVHKHSFMFLSKKDAAMCSLDYLEECENYLTAKEDQTLYMQEFNTYVYLVSSRSQEYFNEEAAISRVPTVQIITDECEEN